MAKGLVGWGVALSLLVFGAAPALACSKDDTAYFDSFLDTGCLQTLNNTELDPFGGIRLTTNGTPSPTTWDTDADFTNGVSYQSTTFPPVGVGTLDIQGTGTSSTLGLHATSMPLVRDAANPVIAPPASSSKDNDNVDDPSVVKAGSTYVMYYSGTAEDGSGPVILRATSTDGKSWTKTGVVLQPTANSDDARGVFAPDVSFDSGSGTYTMYFSGKDDEFGRIFRATSSDGITWDDDQNNDGKPDVVLDHGRPGSADSFSAQDPSVIKDGNTYKMWYTGDDSNRKRVAYATSQDGITWSKGGKVIAPEDGLPANLAEGAFAPTVWKTGSTYNMVLTGRKFVSGTTYQTKLINASSSDGIAWTVGSIALNPSGTNTNFDFSNLNSPFVLQDPSAPANEQFKLYYSGNTVDPVTGGFHTRIGLATSGNGNSWNKFAGSGTGNSVVDITALSSSDAFDSRDASGPSVVEPAGASSKFVGFYWGDRGFDFKPRLGEATSPDGSAWTKVNGSATGNSLLALGNGAAFDNGGQRDPSALYVENTGASQPDYHLYFTALNSSGTQSIGYANAQELAGTLLPDGTTWGNKAQLAIASGTSFDASGVGHPSVVFDGTNYRLYYTGTNSSGGTSIGCATSNNPGFATGGANTVTKNACTVLSPSAGTFDKDGVQDPVVVEIDATHWRMTYTGLEKLSDPGGDVHVIKRIGLATSTDGSTWTKQGVLLDPSQSPYSFDESGVDPAGFVIDGTTIHYYYDGIDRNGRTRGGHASGNTGTTSGLVENGWATYQVGNPSTTVRDWRQIIGTSTGGVTLWVSFLQPYSSSGQEFWSSFFPVNAANATAALDFLLTVRGVRWQVREAGPSTTPTLDKVEIDSAPVQFTPSGSATTTAISPPSTDKLLQWRSLTTTASTYAPNGGSATGTNVLATQTLSTSGATTIDLSSISAAANPTLVVEFDLSGGQASPLVQSLKVLYYTDASPPPPNVTLSAAPSTVNAGDAVTLSGTVTVAGSPSASQQVAIDQQPSGGGFAPLTNATTDVNGNFSLVVNPTTTTSYRATSNGVTSPVVTVTVQPPPIVTLTATPAQVLYGQPVALAGNLRQGGTPLATQQVALLQQPAGTSAFAPFGNATTDASGNYTSTVTPQSNTTYQATFGAAAPATASVGVHQVLTLTATRSGTTGTFKGKITPAHPNRPVVIQLKKGTSFVTFGTAKTSSTSTFTLKKKLKACAKYQFRATTAADADHLDGTSLVALVEKHRVSLTVKVKGRKLLISGKVAPLHKSGTVVIKRVVGKRLVAFAKTKLTKKSTFRLVKSVKKGSYKLRADMGADRCHFAGSSAVRTVRVR